MPHRPSKYSRWFLDCSQVRCRLEKDRVPPKTPRTLAVQTKNSTVTQLHWRTQAQIREDIFWNTLSLDISEMFSSTIMCTEVLVREMQWIHWAVLKSSCALTRTTSHVPGLRCIPALPHCSFTVLSLNMLCIIQIITQTTLLPLSVFSMKPHASSVFLVSVSGRISEHSYNWLTFVLWMLYIFN